MLPAVSSQTSVSLRAIAQTTIDDQVVEVRNALALRARALVVGWI